MLIALLWSNKPVPGPDGLIEAEYQDYVTNMYMHGDPRLGSYLDICLDSSPYQYVVQDAFFVSISGHNQPELARLLLSKFPWTRSLLPKRYTRSGGHTIVIRIKPDDWDKLEAAKSNVAKFFTGYVPSRFVGTGRRRD